MCGLLLDMLFGCLAGYDGKELDIDVDEMGRFAGNTGVAL